MKVLVGNSIASTLRAELAQQENIAASIGRFASTEAFSEIISDVKDQPIAVVSIARSGLLIIRPMIMPCSCCLPLAV